jgi:hypothetical protein
MVYAETLLLYLLAAQGVLGGVDTLFNHELVERLPRRVEARREIGLHSLREALYAVLFIGLGWFEWHGGLALAVAVVLVAEIAVDALDEWTENRIRVLPQNERVLHMILAINLGAIALALAFTLIGWYGLPGGVAVRADGWLSWLLLILGLSSAAWSVRDFAAWRRLSASSDTAGRPSRASAPSSRTER